MAPNTKIHSNLSGGKGEKRLKLNDNKKFLVNKGAAKIFKDYLKGENKIL